MAVGLAFLSHMRGIPREQHDGAERETKINYPGSTASLTVVRAAKGRPSAGPARGSECREHKSDIYPPSSIQRTSSRTARFVLSDEMVPAAVVLVVVG